jgi:hypothetical protein
MMQNKGWVKGLTLICSYCMLHSSISRSVSGGGGSNSSSSDKIIEVIKIIINPIFI